MARNDGVSDYTMRKICREDLRYAPFRLKKAQLLSQATKKRRLERSKKLLQRIKSQTVPNLVFSDEKLFTVSQAHNPQNDRILLRNAQERSERGGQVLRAQNPASVMVWAAISETGRSPLVFVDAGVKINTQVYVDTILKNGLLPWTNNHYSNQD